MLWLAHRIRPEKARRRVQGLVYIFILLASLGVAAAAYFGLTFSPIEAFVTGVSFGTVCVMLVERQLRRRAEARLERGIEDLARLLSTDAQAGQVLSQRVNAIVDINPGNRLDGIEADVSVLGTVVRQLAEAVAEIDEARRLEEGAPAPASVPLAAEDDDGFPEPIISAEQLREALDGDRLLFHIDPVVSLPQRNPIAYELVPRLLQLDGELADAPDFMPRQGGEALLRRIELKALEEAVVVVRRARTIGQPIRLFLPLTRATLLDLPTLRQMLAVLGANQAIAGGLAFAIPQADWKLLGPTDKRHLLDMRKIGVAFVLAGATSLRFDFAELEGVGFAFVRFDATHFLRRPGDFTDFHPADIVPYAKRFEIDLCAGGVIDEQQLLSLFEDGIAFAQGPHVGRPGPVRADLVVERPLPARQRSEASA